MHITFKACNTLLEHCRNFRMELCRHFSNIFCHSFFTLFHIHLLFPPFQFTIEDYTTSIGDFATSGTLSGLFDNFAVLFHHFYWTFGTFPPLLLTFYLTFLSLLWNSRNFSAEHIPNFCIYSMKDLGRPSLDHLIVWWLEYQVRRVCFHSSLLLPL
jgi:hypothetical protein